MAQALCWGVCGQQAHISLTRGCKREQPPGTPCRSGWHERGFNWYLLLMSINPDFSSRWKSTPTPNSLMLKLPLGN